MNLFFCAKAKKSTISNNNIKSKLIIKNNQNINNKEYKYRSKKNKSILNQKLYTETYTNKKLEKYICPNIMEPKEMNIQKKLNRNLNNHKYIFGSPDRSERNNIYKTQFIRNQFSLKFEVVQFLYLIVIYFNMFML